MNQCIAIRLKLAHSSVDIGNHRYTNILLKCMIPPPPPPNPKHVPAGLAIEVYNTSMIVCIVHGIKPWSNNYLFKIAFVYKKTDAVHRCS